MENMGIVVGEKQFPPFLLMSWGGCSPSCQKLKKNTTVVNIITLSDYLVSIKRVICSAQRCKN